MVSGGGARWTPLWGEAPDETQWERCKPDEDRVDKELKLPQKGSEARISSGGGGRKRRRRPPPLFGVSVVLTLVRRDENRGTEVETAKR